MRKFTEIPLVQDAEKRKNTLGVSFFRRTEPLLTGICGPTAELSRSEK